MSTHMCIALVEDCFQPVAVEHCACLDIADHLHQHTPLNIGGGWGGGGTGGRAGGRVGGRAGDYGRERIVVSRSTHHGWNDGDIAVSAKLKTGLIAKWETHPWHAVGVLVVLLLAPVARDCRQPTTVNGR